MAELTQFDVDSAVRISRAVIAVENAVPSARPLAFDPYLQNKSGGIRLGRITATWNKGTLATVTRLDKNGQPLNPTVTFEAKNWFQTVSVDCGYTKVACGQISGGWILIAAECG